MDVARSWDMYRGTCVALSYMLSLFLTDPNVVPKVSCIEKSGINLFWQTAEEQCTGDGSTARVPPQRHPAPCHLIE